MPSALYGNGRSTPAEQTSSRPSPTSSMSDNEPAEQLAFTELDSLVRNLAAELANFRRRALTAEARVKEIEEHEGGAASVALARRISELEHDNERLQSRLDAATKKAKQMLDRVKFLRQQARGGDR